VAPIITATIVHFMFHIRCISIHKLLFNFFFASFCTTFLSAGIATSISVHVFSFLFLIIIAGLFVVNSSSVCTVYYCCYCFHYYYYLLQFSFHSVAVVLTIVANNYINETIQKHSTNHSTYKYTHYQYTHTFQNPHIPISSHY